MHTNDGVNLIHKYVGFIIFLSASNLYIHSTYYSLVSLLLTFVFNMDFRGNILIFPHKSGLSASKRERNNIDKHYFMSVRSVTSHFGIYTHTKHKYAYTPE